MSKNEMCVCGYKGNWIEGEWVCFNDSCGSSRPKRVVNLQPEDMDIKMGIEFKLERKRKHGDKHKADK